MPYLHKKPFPISNDFVTYMTFYLYEYYVFFFSRLLQTVAGIDGYRLKNVSSWHGGSRLHREAVNMIISGGGDA